jgi:ribosome-binding protein aMBF1 (putative translation factor)
VTAEKKTFKRIRRSRKLSAEQAARDEDIRRKVQAEFPPLEGAPMTPVFSDPLKKAIAQSQKSVRELAKEARVSQIVLTQFLAGARDLRLATAEKLAQVLGLKLVAN